jgi:hypothetical protein
VYSGRYAGCSRLDSSRRRLSSKGLVAGALFCITSVGLSAGEEVVPFVLIGVAPSLFAFCADASVVPVGSGAVWVFDASFSSAVRDGSDCADVSELVAACDESEGSIRSLGVVRSVGAICWYAGAVFCASVAAGAREPEALVNR